MSAIDEKELKDYPKPIFYESTKEILGQMTKNICKININGEKGTAFFAKIPVNDKLIPALITNYHLIDKICLDTKKEIEVEIYKEQPRKISLENKCTYYNADYDTTIIEIKESKDGKFDYLEFDENILDDNTLFKCIGNSVYILQYPTYHEDQKLAVSYGIIKNKFEDKPYNFMHFCSTEFGSSGSPILNINSNKVIGIHKKRDLTKNYNIGAFLYYSIIGFTVEYLEKENNKNNQNIINNSNNINQNDNECLKEFFKKFNLTINNINITKLDLSFRYIGNDGLKYSIVFV